MIAFNIYYRFQLKEPVLLCLYEPPTTTHTALFRLSRAYFLIDYDFMIDVIRNRIMITISY